jgi:hypothetical protein
LQPRSHRVAAYHVLECDAGRVEARTLRHLVRVRVRVRVAVRVRVRVRVRVGVRVRVRVRVRVVS